MFYTRYNSNTFCTRVYVYTYILLVFFFCVSDVLGGKRKKHDWSWSRHTENMYVRRPSGRVFIFRPRPWSCTENKTGPMYVLFIVGHRGDGRAKADRRSQSRWISGKKFKRHRTPARHALAARRRGDVPGAVVVVVETTCVFHHAKTKSSVLRARRASCPSCRPIVVYRVGRVAITFCRVRGIEIVSDGPGHWTRSLGEIWYRFVFRRSAAKRVIRFRRPAHGPAVRPILPYSGQNAR